MCIAHFFLIPQDLTKANGIACKTAYMPCNKVIDTDRATVLEVILRIVTPMNTISASCQQIKYKG